MISDESCDVAIIGAGHNGLVCAWYLAKAGLDVRVFEARDVVGGAAVTEEFHPGFRNSVASYTVSLLNPKVIRDMQLEKNGLTVVERRVNNLWPHPDGNFLAFPTGEKELKQEIAQTEQQLAQAQESGDENASEEKKSESKESSETENSGDENSESTEEEGGSTEEKKSEEKGEEKSDG